MLTISSIDNISLLSSLTFSLLQLIPTLNPNWKAVERNLSVDEITQRIEDGSCVDAFGAGTAAVVSPVGTLVYKGKVGGGKGGKGERGGKGGKGGRGEKGRVFYFWFVEFSPCSFSFSLFFFCIIL